MKIRTAILLFVLTLAVVVVVGGAAGSGLAHGQDAPSATSTPFGVYLPLAATSARGSQFVELGSPADLAVVGEPYTSTAPVLVYHEAYSVTGFALVEQAAFGATAPQITPGGLVTWLPTAADVGVHRYGLAATVSDGSQVQESVTIEVAPRTWIISGTVGSEGGAFGMPGDDYYVEIPPNAVAVDADNVHVGVSVVKRAAGKCADEPGVCRAAPQHGAHSHPPALCGRGAGTAARDRGNVRRTAVHHGVQLRSAQVARRAGA
jgi:hypothetical protein